MICRSTQRHLPVRDTPDGSRDLSLGDGLHDECLDPCGACRIGIDEVAVARGHDDWHARPYGRHLPREIDARRIRHGDIGGGEVEAGWFCFEE